MHINLNTKENTRIHLNDHKCALVLEDILNSIPIIQIWVTLRFQFKRPQLYGISNSQPSKGTIQTGRLLFNPVPVTTTKKSPYNI